MVYHGRMPVALVTPEGRPAAGYLVQVRSLPNKKRKFELLSDRLYAAPLDPKDLEKPDADLIFYHTMLSKNGMLFVTNGAQTDMQTLRSKSVRNFHDNFSGNQNDFSGRIPFSEAEAIMSDWGYEPDNMFTPRVALVRYPGCALFAIVSKHENGGVGVISVGVTEASIGLPTYTESNGQAVSLSVENSGYLYENLVHIPVTGNTAEEIANQLYEFSDPKLIVASAGAVFRNGKWEIAFKNKFNSLEDYERFAAEVK